MMAPQPQMMVQPQPQPHVQLPAQQAGGGQKGGLPTALMITVMLIGTAILLEQLPELLGEPVAADYADDGDADSYAEAVDSHATLVRITASLSIMLTQAAGLVISFGLIKTAIVRNRHNDGLRIAMIAGGCYILAQYISSGISLF